MPDKAKYHFVKAKLYKFVAIIFAVIGLALCFILSTLLIDNDPSVVLREPWLVLIILMPFLPACVLSLLADKHRSKLKQLVEKKRGV